MTKHYRPITQREYKKLKDASGIDNGLSLFDTMQALGAKREYLLGMIGTGRKVHELYCYTIEAEHEMLILHASSHCGSQRWNWGRGYSQIRVTPGAEITCKKCLK